MKVPIATYRLQFHSQFTFQQALKVIDYLSALGISDIYASPIFKARKDSTHGYDVTDPTQINPQLGGRDDFNRLIGQVKGHGMGWVQDIVPNHMAFDSDNRWLMDILEKGPMSKFYNFFDIQWDHPYEHLKGKVLAPILGDLYGNCLDKNEIKLSFSDQGFQIVVYDWKFPLKLECYSKVLASNLMALEGNISPNDQAYIQLLEMTNGLKNLSSGTDRDDYFNQAALIKARLWALYTSNPIIKDYIDTLVAAINGIPGDPHSLDRLDELLSRQNFRLSFWKVGHEELNYRRFFTINTLLSTRMEDKQVFDYTHELILQLVRAGDLSGLRIDHIDGLYNPLAYVRQLKQREPEVYLVVEKILDLHEHLPSCMPVEGTTGYDFMNTVNKVFIDRDNEKLFDRLYTSFTGLHMHYHSLVSDKKKYFMGKYMAGDIDNLALLLKNILNTDRYGRDLTMYALRRAIVEIMAQFPVYRAYACEQEAGMADQIYIKEAVVRAQNKNPTLVNELNFIQQVLLLNFSSPGNGKQQDSYHFAKKFQQFSGALMAKGAEDTSFYIYNRFASLNEVGSDPSLFGISVKDFHELMATRRRLWPHTMNASATHDTKRGEDVRARLNVLSQMPREWEKRIRLWNKFNRNKKRFIHSLQVRAPVRNDEYLIYQTLLGAFPFDENERASFVERMKNYVIKAIREAQMYTSWLQPNHEYEEACVLFIDELFDPKTSAEFLENFLPFQKDLAARGIANSLSQTLLKLTAPGVPDFYQGTELWDLSLVDPDNRRPVDYERRRTILDEIKRRSHEPSLIDELIDHKEDGRIKLFLIYQALQTRRAYEHVFAEGEYLPLEIQGPGEKTAIAFIRKLGDTWILAGAGRFFDDQTRQKLWPQTTVVLPDGAPMRWKNVLTGEVIEGAAHMPLSRLFERLTVALWVTEAQDIVG